MITLTGKYEHITPAFIALHMLPIKERCEFKILLLTYKCFNGLTLKNCYIKDLTVDLAGTMTICLLFQRSIESLLGGLHLKELLLTSGIVYLLLYVTAKLLTFLYLD